MNIRSIPNPHSAFRIALLGGGNISETHARAARAAADVEIAAVFGTNRQKVQRLVDLFGGIAYDDLDRCLAHRALDLVMIGSPSGLHAAQGIAAARRGLHVLVEKPIDITTARADALVSEADRAGVKLGVIFQDRLKRDLCRVKRFLDAGGLGRPVVASARVKWYRPPEYYGDSRWRGTLELDGGGALINQAIHTVDLLLWLLGPVASAYGRIATRLHAIRGEDTAVAVLEFANGAVGTLEATTAAFPGYARRLEVTGSEGTIIIEQDRVVAANLRSPRDDLRSDGETDRNPSASSPVVSDASGHQAVLEDFIEAIRTGGKPSCDGLEGRRSLELVQAIYESAGDGRAVSLGAPV
jgi:predicted dehydrogenase